MARFDLYKTLTHTGHALKQLSVFNPLTIHRKEARAKAIFALALVCFFWGTTWIASKEGVRHMPALQLAGIRQFLGGCCYVIFFLARRATLPRRKEWLTILVLCFLNFIMSNGLSTLGLKYNISAGLAAIIGAIFPLWLVIIGLFSRGSRIPTKAIVGLLIGFGGICVIFYEHLQDFFNPDFRFGIFLSLLATLTWAFGTLYTKKQAVNFNPYFSLGLQMMIAGLVLTAFTSVSEPITGTSYSIPISEIPWQSWAAIAYLVIFGSIVAFIAYLYALQHLPTEQASIYAYINPVVAVLMGWALFDEHLTLFIAVGGAITLSGLYLVNKAFKAALPPPEQPEPEGM